MNKNTQSLYKDCFERYCISCSLCISNNDWDDHIDQVHRRTLRVVPQGQEIVQRKQPLKIIPTMVSPYYESNNSSTNSGCCKENTRKSQLSQYISNLWHENEDGTFIGHILKQLCLIILALAIGIIVFVVLCLVLANILPAAAYTLGWGWALVKQAAFLLLDVFSLLKYNWNSGHRVVDDDKTDLRIQDWSFDRFNSSLTDSFIGALENVNKAHYERFKSNLSCAPVQNCMEKLGFQSELVKLKDSVTDYSQAYENIKSKLFQCEDGLLKFFVQHKPQQGPDWNKIATKIGGCRLFLI